ncbi:unnamed protein product [Mytilus coruscus]|uniref:Uncharacterized protein n=1 Tax=Mytilus coruscus TaxID=42192 RepID=A0A6J7ZZG2_MYTCO|nr:unnamed protein product [Mytilus coruscus]
MASANEVLKACHHGYSNHLATIDNDCEIMYCAQTGALSELKFPRVQLPPFTGIPAESIETPANYIISHDGQSWMQLIDPATKNPEPEENKWTTLQSAHVEMRSLLKTFENNQVKYTADEGNVERGCCRIISRSNNSSMSGRRSFHHHKTKSETICYSRI